MVDLFGFLMLVIIGERMDLVNMILCGTFIKGCTFVPKTCLNLTLISSRLQQLLLSILNL